MASPQWKNFQPSAQDSAMPSYQSSPSFSKTSNGNHENNQSGSPNGGSGALRETGIVEKLLHSYGFIQCCERQARLFFHYSQYSGNIEHLKLGDPVEFEMTYDRRTGKPIASSVVKISPEAGEVLSEERVSGFITTEIKEGTDGRVAYESRGECFFLPYAKDDLEGNLDLHPHDKVTFRIATDKKTGNLRARNIQLEQPLPQRYQGVICALKETFGFIERADVVKEIFFHSSECKDFKSLKPGADVEFSIHTRNNKEVAVNITTLSPGTVVFEDIDSEVFEGQVSKPLERERSRQSSEAFPGKIQCQQEDGGMVEYSFGERDTKGEFTLYSGDWVQFNVATDRRDGLQRATNIELMPESLNLSNEKREQGVVAAVKDTFGFIRYGNRESRLYFRLSELLNWEHMIRPQEEVEFTVVQDPSSQGRYQAIRIQVLPPGTVNLDSNTFTDFNTNEQSTSNEDRYCISGVVEREALSPWSSKSPHKGRGNKSSDSDEDSADETASEDGIILFYKDGAKEKINYSAQDCVARNHPRVGDKVEFTLVGKQGDLPRAGNVRIVGSKVRNGYRYTHRGYIAALKDSFGFIENEDHDREVFFHYSVFDGNASSLQVGQEVEYALTHKGNKSSAECVRRLSSGAIPGEDIQPDVMNGVIVSPVRCFNPDQENYAGRIRLTTDAENVEEDPPEYEFGITSLTDKHEFLQKGDVVEFQIGITKKGQERAVNIKSIRTKVQSTVDTIKGHFGFLAYEAEEGKKLFFHMSEVKDGVHLQPGDKVEFVVLHHQRTGKYSACSVVKIGESQPSQRPERLISRLRTLTTEDNSGPRLIIVRHPKGPDGSEGFKFPRKERIADSALVMLNGEDSENSLDEHLLGTQNGYGFTIGDDSTNDASILNAVVQAVG